MKYRPDVDVSQTAELTLRALEVILKGDGFTSIADLSKRLRIPGPKARRILATLIHTDWLTNGAEIMEISDKGSRLYNQLYLRKKAELDKIRKHIEGLRIDQARVWTVQDIKDLREQHALTQKKLSELLDCSQTLLSMVESNTKQIPNQWHELLTSIDANV